MKKVVNKIEVKEVSVSECDSSKVYIMEHNGEFSLLTSRGYMQDEYVFLVLDNTCTFGNAYDTDNENSITSAIGRQVKMKGRTVYQFDTMAEAMQFCFPKD